MWTINPSFKRHNLQIEDKLLKKINMQQHRTLKVPVKNEMLQNLLTLHSCCPCERSSNGCLEKQREHANKTGALIL